MDEQEKSKLKKTYKELPEEKLLELLATNAAEYEEGIYELIMEVAKEKGALKGEDSSKLGHRAKEQIKENRADAFEVLVDRKKSSWFTLLLNIIIPGLGLIYCERYIFGVIIFIITLATVIIVTAIQSSIAEYINFILYYWLFLVAVSFHVTMKYNDALNEKIKAAMKLCPACIERVHPIAQVCKHCSHKFSE